MHAICVVILAKGTGGRWPQKTRIKANIKLRINAEFTAEIIASVFPCVLEESQTSGLKSSRATVIRQGQVGTCEPTKEQSSKAGLAKGGGNTTSIA